MSRAKVWFAVALAALLAPPGAASAQNDEVADSMRSHGWTNVSPMNSATSSFYGRLINRSDWSNPPFPECSDVESAFDALADGGLWYSGDHTGRWSEYFPVYVVDADMEGPSVKLGFRCLSWPRGGGSPEVLFDGESS